jgi:hypothetical protein
MDDDKVIATIEELNDTDKIVSIVEKCKKVCETCQFRIGLLYTDLNKYGVGKCLKRCCDNCEVAPISIELAKKISRDDPNSEDEWD